MLESYMTFAECSMGLTPIGVAILIIAIGIGMGGADIPNRTHRETVAKTLLFLGLLLVCGPSFLLGVGFICKLINFWIGLFY